jgi:hypothetical protein
MNTLEDIFGLNTLLNTSALIDEFKENSLELYEAYNTSSPEVKRIQTGSMRLGRFYHIHYNDSSNWMKYSPIYICSVKKFSNQIVIYAVNLNFLPLAIRVNMFSQIMNEKDIESNAQLQVSHKEIYALLRKYGFEYALMEFNFDQVLAAHEISLTKIDTFLISAHPRNKYDPSKLYSIWQTKLKDREARDREIVQLDMNDLYNIANDISNKFSLLKGHIKRVQKSYKESR